MALTLSKKAAQEENVAVEAKTEEAAVAEATAPAGAEEVANDTVGTLSAKIAFVAPLGNPLKDDVTIIKGKDGQENKKVTPFIVGYRLKALEDIDVPECGTTDNFKKDYMDYADINGKKHVAAGETFDVTPFEMAVLAADPRVNRTFSGGERVAICCWSKKEFTGSKTGDVTVKAVPRAVLRLTEGSIKDYNYIEVCSKTVEMDESGKQRKVGHINPGFEKWAPLCKASARTAGGRTAGARSSKPIYDPNAANFMSLLRTKGFNN